MSRTSYKTVGVLIAAFVLGSSNSPVQFYTDVANESETAVKYLPPIVANAADAPLPEGHPKIDMPGRGAPAAPKFDFSKIVKPKGGKTVQEVYLEKASLSGKRVTIRAKVVKYNGEIMGKNWLHVRDGTGAEGNDDLTVTTQAKAKVGDTVMVDGIVRLEKDFGAGYQYDVIIEDAKVKVE